MRTLRVLIRRPVGYAGGLVAVMTAAALAGRALSGPAGASIAPGATQPSKPLPGVVRTLDGQTPVMGTHAIWFYIRGKYRMVPP